MSESRTTITIEFKGLEAQAVSDLTRAVDLGTLLRDALGEFIATREPIAAYVAKRYGENAPLFRSFKAREAEKRNSLAALLKRGDVTIEVSHV